MLKLARVNSRYLVLLALFMLLPMRVDAENGIAPKLSSLKTLIETYRQASARLQKASVEQRIPYCVFNEYDPLKRDKTRVSWQMVDGARKFLSRSPYIDQIVADAQGLMNKHQGVPVKTALFNIFQGLVPLDTDTFRVLRQTSEYDRQNLAKFEIYAGGLDKIAPEAAEGRAREQLRRLAGTFGFGGLDQLLGYVQRDFLREFNGKRMMNFGSCEGAADLVVEIGASLQAERAAITQMVSLLGELAQGE